MRGPERIVSFLQRAPDRLLDDEARHHVGRVDDAFALAFRDLGRRLAATLGLEPFDVGDGLLEDVAEHGDRHFAPVVPGAERCDVFGEAVGQQQGVDDGIVGEQAAVVGRYRHVVLAAIDQAEEPDEILPDRQRIEFILRFQRPFEQAIRQQVRAFGEGDEQNPVENLLGDLDGRQ